MKSFFTFILTAFLFLSSCSSSTETTNNRINITPSKKLQNSSLHFTVPSGWREIKDNSDRLFEVWLINDQSNAAISFIQIYLHNIDDNSVDENLNIITEISLNKREAVSSDFEILNKEVFEVNNLKVVELHYLLDNTTQNLLIFSDGIQYYECLAYFNNEHNPNDSELENLLTIQQQIISELKIN